MTATDLADLSASAASALMAQKDVSPVDLVEACLDRAEGANAAVNALVAQDVDALRAAAREAETELMNGTPRGPLHGLPVAIKDMNDVAGLPTTYGSEVWRDYVAAKDDALVAGLRTAGALILGKTNVPEWSAGANTRNRVYGATANPYDVTRTCAGSSGGSAVSLACGFAPLATGSDLAGSLRTPAAYCGVVGFRPTPGVVPDPGKGAALLPFGTDGPMARNATDCALLLRVMARPDRADPLTPVKDGEGMLSGASPTLPRSDLGSLRIAFTEDFGIAHTSAETRSLLRAAMTGLASDAPLLTEATPDCAGADDMFSVLRGLSFLDSHAKLYDTQRALVGPNVAANVEEGRQYSAADVSRALTEQGAYYRRWQAFFDTHDYLIAPTATVGPFSWRSLYPQEIDGQPMQNYYHWLGLAYAVTLAGHPSVSVPFGRDANGMPFGVQVIGRRYDDLGVLSLAAELERFTQGTDWAHHAPDLDALRNAPPLNKAEGFMGFD